MPRSWQRRARRASAPSGNVTSRAIAETDSVTSEVILAQVIVANPQRHDPRRNHIKQVFQWCSLVLMSVLVVSNEFQTSHLSQLQEEMVEVAQLISHECMQDCVVEQPGCRPAAGGASDQGRNRGCCAAAFTSRAHIQECIVKQCVDILVQGVEHERVTVRSGYPSSSGHGGADRPAKCTSTS